MPHMAAQAFRHDSRWTQQQWHDWIIDSTFDRDQMNQALEIWKEEIFPAELTQRTGDRENDAASNNQRRDIRRNAFRAWQKQKYAHTVLAKTFLKFPVADLDKLLDYWLDTCKQKST